MYSSWSVWKLFFMLLLSPWYICVYYTENISTLQFLLSSQVHILSMPELMKFFIIFFNNGKYLLTFIKFNRFMKKNKPKIFNGSRTESNESWNLQAVDVCLLKSDLSIKGRLRQKRYYFLIKKGFREVYLHALHDSR